MIRRSCSTRCTWVPAISPALFLIAIFLMMMALSLGREIGINVKSGDDIASWCMAAMAFLGLAHTFKSGEMIRVGLLTERLTGRTKWLTELFALRHGSLLHRLLRLARGRSRPHVLAHQRHVARACSSIPLWIPQTRLSRRASSSCSSPFVDELVHVARGNKPRYEKARRRPPRR